MAARWWRWPACMWSGHTYVLWRAKWKTGQPPTLIVWRCEACGHERGGE